MSNPEEEISSQTSHSKARISKMTDMQAEDIYEKRKKDLMGKLWLQRQESLSKKKEKPHILNSSVGAYFKKKKPLKNNFFGTRDKQQPKFIVFSDNPKKLQKKRKKFKKHKNKKGQNNFPNQSLEKEVPRSFNLMPSEAERNPSFDFTCGTSDQHMRQTVQSEKQDLLRQDIEKIDSQIHKETVELTFFARKKKKMRKLIAKTKLKINVKLKKYIRDHHKFSQVIIEKEQKKQKNRPNSYWLKNKQKKMKNFGKMLFEKGRDFSQQKQKFIKKERQKQRRQRKKACSFNPKISKRKVKSSQSLFERAKRREGDKKKKIRAFKKKQIEDDLRKCSFKPKINMKSASLFKASIQSTDFYVRTMRWKKTAERKVIMTRESYYRSLSKKPKKKRQTPVKMSQTQTSFRTTKTIQSTLNFKQFSSQKKQFFALMKRKRALAKKKKALFNAGIYNKPIKVFTKYVQNSLKNHSKIKNVFQYTENRQKGFQSLKKNRDVSQQYKSDKKREQFEEEIGKTLKIFKKMNNFLAKVDQEVSYRKSYLNQTPLKPSRFDLDNTLKNIQYQTTPIPFTRQTQGSPQENRMAFIHRKTASMLKSLKKGKIGKYYAPEIQTEKAVRHTTQPMTYVINKKFPNRMRSCANFDKENKKYYSLLNKAHQLSKKVRKTMNKTEG